MGSEHSEKEHMEENTQRTLQLLDSALPDDATVNPVGLAFALYASEKSYTAEITHQSIEDAFHEFTTGENMNPFEGDELPDELRANVSDFEYQPDGDVSNYNGDDTSFEQILYDAIQHSWEVIPRGDQLLIDYHAAVVPYLHKSAPIVAALPSEIAVGENTRKLDPTFQQRCFVLSCLALYSEIRQSTFTEREGVIYHLSTRFNSKEMAAILENSFGGSVSSGTVRKSISRIKDKIGQAESMADTFSTDDVQASVELTPSPISLLSEDVISEVATFVKGVLQTQSYDGTEESWEIAENDEITLAIAVKPSLGDIRLSLYCDIDRLPSPATVDVNQYGESELIIESTTEGDLSTFSSLSDEFNTTFDDLRLALEYAFRQSDYLMVDSHLLSPVSTEVFESEDSAGGGFVNFGRYLNIEKPEA